MDTRIDILRRIVEIQSTDGNWNYDHYMHGMANGLILALSIIEDTTPAFKDAPERFIAAYANDKEPDDNPCQLDCL